MGAEGRPARNLACAERWALSTAAALWPSAAGAAAADAGLGVLNDEAGALVAELGYISSAAVLGFLMTVEGAAEPKAGLAGGLSADPPALDASRLPRLPLLAV